MTFYSDGVITTNITAKTAANETKKRIVAIMSGNPYVTVKDIAAELGIAERNIKNHIKALKNAGTIDRVGATKNGYWVVK